MWVLSRYYKTDTYILSSGSSGMVCSCLATLSRAILWRTSLWIDSLADISLAIDSLSLWTEIARRWCSINDPPTSSSLESLSASLDYNNDRKWINSSQTHLNLYSLRQSIDPNFSYLASESNSESSSPLIACWRSSTLFNANFKSLRAVTVSASAKNDRTIRWAIWEFCKILKEFIILSNSL